MYIHPVKLVLELLMDHIYDEDIKMMQIRGKTEDKILWC